MLSIFVIIIVFKFVPSRKVIFSTILGAIVIGAVLGEAPLPQYGPPGFGGGNGRPSSNYGAPGGGGNGGFGGGGPSSSYGPPGGSGNGYGGGDDGGKPEPFNFEYEVKDAASGNDFGHKASSDASGRVTGQYHVLLPDGRNQIVDYTADDSGYNAQVKYEGEANAGGGGGGYPAAGGGYPSGPSNGGGYPSGPSGGGFPSGNGGYPSAPGGGSNGYPSGGPPSSSYLPPGK